MRAETPLVALLDELDAAVRKYVVLPSAEAADAVVLWTAATHVQAAWEHAPRLVIKAPEKRCGKSRLLDVIEATCHAPLMSVHASAASIYRAIGAAGTTSLTLLVDESDALFGGKQAAENEDLRALLNAGHQRNRRVPRWNANLNKLEQLDTFAMVALAGIGSMPDTIEDRAVIVSMRRRAAGESVAAFRYRRDAVALHGLRNRLAEHLKTLVSVLEVAEPEMPVEDRAADTWEPLIAVADVAGGRWPERARRAAIVLTKAADQAVETSTQLRLLNDCREVLRGVDKGLRTTVLLERLHALEGAGWDSYGPAGLTARRLAILLNTYGIVPGEGGKNIRWAGDAQGKGYFSDDFTDAWNRYLPPLKSELEPGEPSHPSQGSQEGDSRRSEADSTWDGSDARDGSSVPLPQLVPGGKVPLTCGNTGSGTGGTDGTGTGAVSREERSDLIVCGCPNRGHGFHRDDCGGAECRIEMPEETKGGRVR